MKLDGRVAVITAADSGMGRASAELFAAEGAPGVLSAFAAAGMPGFEVGEVHVEARDLAGFVQGAKGVSAGAVRLVGEYADDGH